MSCEDTIDYGKVDASLAAALAEVDDADRRALSVFIHVDDPGDRGQELLRALGSAGGVGEHQTWTATLSAREVADLSGRPWVRRLRLSSRLDLC